MGSNVLVYQLRGRPKSSAEDLANMNRMANRASYLEFLVEQLSPLGEITTRRLFGATSLYCDGTVFALVARDTLYLKVDDHNRADFQASGLEAFQPFDDERVS